MYTSLISRYIPLREIIKNKMKERNISQFKLAKLSQISQATLSATLAGNRQFSLDLVDQLTESLQLPEGALYPYFESELYGTGGMILPKKLCHFIEKCYSVHLDSIGKKFIPKLSEINNKKYSKDFFSIAEKLNELGYINDATEIYKLVIGIEKTKIAESGLLDLCYYRLFNLSKNHVIKDTYWVNT